MIVRAQNSSGVFPPANPEGAAASVYVFALETLAGQPNSEPPVDRARRDAQAVIDHWPLLCFLFREHPDCPGDLRVVVAPEE